MRTLRSHGNAKTGTTTEATQRLKFVERKVEKNIALKRAMVSKDLLDVDLFINVPVAKHHEGCVLTGNLKNFMHLS